ncbi:sn-glycerol-3-phosphate ABC transporter ATP-binding protein UgpC (plasmid) [Agrobacterium tumefaciens]|uniref:ABC transporter ATP-binding protein n=1 Tax=Agrobacterium tumefaciens TaxID=358 RepID=UPI001572D68A|nr:sn-glycerol-3-phosphate ABC transporter ATP-binding protein UgpC [Agrobacterium tumefaciens]NSZ66263.1 sn-glycerol-3-phosphate ABC transporter ATP-binding protein UgpC [Agrobacterium tumefaciens]NTA72635.1 sn-glycerol-3-phosphate ABC transporter ATP-binding protein UgpC [Agrobacterium tumefaciens]WIE41871.1 sn-glycerol-3-phosphate ABC transporter ATP-binding protein UgpC [Agrobacterium tumefaciens]
MANLSFEGVKKIYDGKQVVHGLDIEIKDGQFVVIVGPSGCGKSTLLRMIAGLEDITEGRLAIDGIQMNDVEPSRRGCAMVFQNYALYPHMTVRENMAYPLKIARMPKPERDRRVEETAEILALGEYLDRRPAQLSGGQRQRVAMGRAIVREPGVFLFDEPLSNLDAKLRVQMRIEIRRLHRRLQATSIFVTHDQVEAMTLADMLIVMNGGRIEQMGPPSDIYRRPASTFVAAFMGSPAMNLAPIIRISDDRFCFASVPDFAIDIADPGVDEMTIGIRPEDVVVSFEATDGLATSIDLVEELGGTRIAYCPVGTTEFAVVLPADAEDYQGRAVFLKFPEPALHIFDAVSGTRLAQGSMPNPATHPTVRA